MGAKRAKSDETKLQASMSASRAATLLAYLAAAGVEGPEAPPAEILEPYRKREGKKDRSAMTQLGYALSAEKDDANRCVLVNACWLEGILSHGGTCNKETGSMQGEQESTREDRTDEPTSENCDEPDDDIFYDSVEPDPMQQSETPSPSHEQNKSAHAAETSDSERACMTGCDCLSTPL